MRAFIAIEIPTHLRARLSSLRQTAAGLLAERQLASVLRWSSADNYHLTLRFLGDITAGQRDSIDNLLGDVAAVHPPLTLGLEGLGAFPHWRKMRVLWAGITGDLSSLNALQGTIESGVLNCGFDPDRQGFHPHTTLARTSRNAKSAQIRQAGDLLSGQTKLARHWGQWNVTELVLMRSERRPSGAVYTVQGRYPLDG